ncbi:MAG TPA: hypothetical protein VJ815_01560 [Acidimicrobiia bacterium]|nr:hypothetical protein [Acidimicrobiia bacterium]
MRVYTAGLEPELGSERRAEIDSDLWEHRQRAVADRQSEMATAFAIWGRWAGGVPADLSWRATQRRNRQSHRKDLSMINPFGRNWWQHLAALAALGSGYLGVQQFLSDDVTIAITPGKVGGLVTFLGGGLMVLFGLVVLRRYPRRGAGLVLIGLAPTALIGGLGLGTILGLIVALVGGEEWWWLPTAIISTTATAAGVGAFGAWWNATPTRVGYSRRAMLVPVITILAGLLAGFAGVGMGIELMGLAGVVVVGLGVTFWARRLRSAP